MKVFIVAIVLGVLVSMTTADVTLRIGTYNLHDFGRTKWDWQGPKTDDRDYIKRGLTEVCVACLVSVYAKLCS